MTPPRRCREIQAERERKGLSLRDLAFRAKVNYFHACRVLKGRAVDVKALSRLELAASRAPMPRGGCRVKPIEALAALSDYALRGASPSERIHVFEFLSVFRQQLADADQNEVKQFALQAADVAQSLRAADSAQMLFLEVLSTRKDGPMSAFTYEPEWSPARQMWRYEIVDNASGKRVAFTAWHKLAMDALKDADAIIAKRTEGAVQ